MFHMEKEAYMFDIFRKKKAFSLSVEDISNNDLISFWSKVLCL